MWYKMEWFKGTYGGRSPKGIINVLLSNTTWVWATEALKPGEREEIYPALESVIISAVMFLMWDSLMEADDSRYLSYMWPDV